MLERRAFQFIGFMLWCSIALFTVFVVKTMAGGRRMVPDTAPAASPVASINPVPISPKESPEPFIGHPVRFIADQNYATREEALKIERASRIVRELIDSECAAKWLSARKMIDTNGRSPSQVVDHLRSLTGVVPVRMYYRRMGKPFGTSAVAYRQPPDVHVNLNRAFFSLDLPDVEWAATLAHEGLGHSKGGYGHDFRWSPSRSYSVPYSLGGSDTAQGGDVFSNCFGKK